MVFYDCEFTDLSPDSALLSIGLVAADSDAELYIEIADADLRGSSDFVKEIVLPLFGRHAPEVLTRTASAARIETWLDIMRGGDRQRQIQMIADSSWDWDHFLSLFPTRSPGEQAWTVEFNLVDRMVQHILDLGRPGRTLESAMATYHQQHGEQHHALVDARALKLGWMAAKR
ncbi:MAG: 3'-5' exoribonuclease [Sulfuritalea sp.]|nr:3'-5' exoribonuclease [Sulfuritalea sp.]